MDPEQTRLIAALFGLPRTRGDGPLDTGLTSIQKAAPPHPRGWTPDPQCRYCHHAGSPAPAGMDPVSDGS